MPSGRWYPSVVTFVGCHVGATAGRGTGRWEAAARVGAACSLGHRLLPRGRLPDGRVLVIGGVNDSGKAG